MRVQCVCGHIVVSEGEENKGIELAFIVEIQNNCSAMFLYLETTGSRKEGRKVWSASIGDYGDTLGLQELKSLSNVQDGFDSCTDNCHGCPS